MNQVFIHTLLVLEESLALILPFIHVIFSPAVAGDLAHILSCIHVMVSAVLAEHLVQLNVSMNLNVRSFE